MPDYKVIHKYDDFEDALKDSSYMNCLLIFEQYQFLVDYYQLFITKDGGGRLVYYLKEQPL